MKSDSPIRTRFPDPKGSQIQQRAYITLALLEQAGRREENPRKLVGQAILAYALGTEFVPQTRWGEGQHMKLSFDPTCVLYIARECPVSVHVHTGKGKREKTKGRGQGRGEEKEEERQCMRRG